MFKDAVYSSVLFCKSCGMDVGFNPVRRRIKDKMLFYCCEECAENG